ncbi:MAG: hypothetical protein IPK26_27385 [Planctomycetes bacterium]|nr:hypothetical protein [Planctomycetota bacterium]
MLDDLVGVAWAGAVVLRVRVVLAAAEWIRLFAREAPVAPGHRVAVVLLPALSGRVTAELRQSLVHAAERVAPRVSVVDMGVCP